MPAKKAIMWVQNGEAFTATLPDTTLVVSQIKMSGDWRAEHYESKLFGRLQIARVGTKSEAQQVCEEWYRGRK